MTRSAMIEEKLKEILDWMEDHPAFDGLFVESLNEQFLATGDLTENQIRALDNILEKWVNR